MQVEIEIKVTIRGRYPEESTAKKVTELQFEKKIIVKKPIGIPSDLDKAMVRYFEKIETMSKNRLLKDV